MDHIEVFINNNSTGELFYNNKDNSYGFNYKNYEEPVSLIMPCNKSTYIWKNKLHPIFEMNMPEGYLYQLFRDIISKQHGYLNDYLVFSYLAPSIESRLTYKSNFKTIEYSAIDFNKVMENDTEDTFNFLLKTFLQKNAISGVQPKTIALLTNKTSLTTKEYIVKTWGEEFDQLAANEYYCLKAVERAGVKIPHIELSANDRFLLVERFNFDRCSNSFLGFEEVLVLLGKNSTEKYSGSYEQVARVVYTLSSSKIEDMKILFKIIVMNFLLGNGDAHLKNFGILYNSDLSEIRLAPAYDIVNTLVYIYRDRPALTISGNKLWFGKKALIKFGIKSCMLNNSQANKLYDECKIAVNETIKDIKNHLDNKTPFKKIGERMISTMEILLREETIKELPDELIRSW